MLIVCFIGSPILEDEKGLIKPADRLKKEKVNDDTINFGENEANQQKLSGFMDTINGKDGTGSHLKSVARGTVLHDILVTSPVVAGKDGYGLPGTGLGLEFVCDEAEDPDLFYALRVSMEDQRIRQVHEVYRDDEITPTVTTLPRTSAEAMLKQASAMSMQMNNTECPSLPMDIDLAAMSEVDQVTYVLRMSLQQIAGEGEETVHSSTTILESDKVCIPLL
ncbi:26S proteasome non-ATPase regulatory subunit 4 [Schistosoma japonicum]|nr:26S proteasome non-ATPase regulatory subunit 4 [Schistosoma japonicum]